MSYRPDLDDVTPPDAVGQVPPELHRTLQSAAPHAANATPFFPKAWLVCAGRTPHGDLVHEKEQTAARLRALNAKLDALIALLSCDVQPME